MEKGGMKCKESLKDECEFERRPDGRDGLRDEREGWFEERKEREQDSRL